MLVQGVLVACSHILMLVSSALEVCVIDHAVSMIAPSNECNVHGFVHGLPYVQKECTFARK